MRGKSKFSKVLLIHPPSVISVDKRKFPPLGILSLASYLFEKGEETVIVDLNVEQDKTNINELLKYIRSQKPNIIGVSLSSDNFDYMSERLSRIKEEFQETRLIIGGPHVTIEHQKILQSYSYIDAAVRGEGEITFYELVQAIKQKKDFKNILGISYRNKERIIVNPPRPLIKDLNTLPPLNRKLLRYPERYTYVNEYVHDEKMRKLLKKKTKTAGSVITSRGCPYNCSFCCVPRVYSAEGSRLWRPRSIQSVLNEAYDLIENYGVMHIYFMDDNFFLIKNRALSILDRIKSKYKDFSFTAATRVNFIAGNAEFIRKLKELGLTTLEVGLESGSDEVLRRFNKGTTVEQNIEAVEILRKYKINIGPDFIFFDPFTTLDDLEKNITFF